MLRALLKIPGRITRMPILLHVAAIPVVFAGFNWIKAALDKSYAASQHPVDYATGQTTFSGPMIKTYYAHMESAGTLDIYRTTQMIDFGFLALLGVLGLLIACLFARLGREESWARTIGMLAGLSIVVGAIMDALENLMSFVLLADPSGFADWLALPYSAFAVAKFGFITLGMFGILLCILFVVIGRLTKRPALA